ncbi:MAG: hypothetical protein V4557_02995 [Bacteroidota bacterium]
MKLFATALCFFLTVLAASSQTTPEDSVKLAIGKFFTSIRNSDGIGFRQAFMDTATYINMNVGQSGEPVMRATSIMELALLFSSARGYDPRIGFDMVKVSGFLASAWVPFKLYVNGQQTYCAVASIQMIRVKGVWKIQYYIDRKVSCQGSLL